MSCVNFPTGITVSQAELMREIFGSEVAFDGYTALYNGALEVDSKKLGDLAKETKQYVGVSIHGDGELITMRDGSKYRVTQRGWQKLDPNQGE